MKGTALVIIDVQEALVNAHPVREKQFLANLKQLLYTARENNVPVLYVQHCDEELVPGSAGWQVYHEIAPLPGEKTFRKHFTSAFRQTDFGGYLQQHGIRSLVFAGMQTEYCVDTTCRVAFEYGYSIVIPEGATATFDSRKFTSAAQLQEYYEQDIWNGRFAQVLPMEQVLESLCAKE